MKYGVGKEKGSSRFFICREGEGVPLSPERYTEKKKALKQAAALEGMTYKEYMKAHRQNGIEDKDGKQ